MKNYFLTQDQTISRKAKEIIISIKVDGQMSKDDILQNYLNTIYYGRGAYTASQNRGPHTSVRRWEADRRRRCRARLGDPRRPSLYDPALGWPTERT